MRLKLDLKTLSSQDEFTVAGEKITFPREKGTVHEVGHPEDFTKHAFHELIALAARYDFREEPKGRIFKNRAKKFQEKCLHLGATADQLAFFNGYDIGAMGRVNSSTTPEKTYRYRRYGDVLCEAIVFLLKQWNPNTERFNEETLYKGQNKPTFLAFKEFFEELIETYNVKKKGFTGKTSRLFTLWKVIETRAHFFEGIHDSTTMLGSRLANAEARVQAAEAGMLEAAAQTNELNDVRNELLRQVQDLRAQVERQAPIVENNLEVVGALQANLAAQASINSALSQELADQKQLTENFRSRLQETERLPQDVKSAQQLITQSQKEIVTLKKKLEAKKPSKQTPIIETLKEQVTRGVSENEKLRLENEQLKQENSQLKLDVAALVKTLKGFFSTVTAWFRDLPETFFSAKSKEPLAEGKTYAEALHADHEQVTLALNRYGFHNANTEADKVDNAATAPVVKL